jgi:hypothetical protein
MEVAGSSEMSVYFYQIRVMTQITALVFQEDKQYQSLLGPEEFSYMKTFTIPM